MTNKCRWVAWFDFCCLNLYFNIQLGLLNRIFPATWNFNVAVGPIFVFCVLYFVDFSNEPSHLQWQACESNGLLFSLKNVIWFEYFSLSHKLSLLWPSLTYSAVKICSSCTGTSRRNTSISGCGPNWIKIFPLLWTSWNERHRLTGRSSGPGQFVGLWFFSVTGTALCTEWQIKILLQMAQGMSGEYLVERSIHFRLVNGHVKWGWRGREDQVMPGDAWRRLECDIGL